MQSEFITTKGKLTVKGKWISERTIVEQPENYWVHSFMILGLLILYSLDQLNSRPHKIITIFMCVIWISPHFVRIYRILFVNVWRQNIPLKEIRDIILDDQYNELEDKVTLTLQSGRKKVYLFRKAEAQANGFVSAVTEHLNSRSLVVE